MNILLIDDDPAILYSVAELLRINGHDVAAVEDGKQAIDQLGKVSFDLVITDVRLPGYDGFAILKKALASARPPEVVLMTAHSDINSAIAALKLGASDYLIKPFESDHLLCCIADCDERQFANRAFEASSSEIEPGADGIIGRSEEIANVQAQVAAMGPSEASIVISGETGTGKELVAQALHRRSARKGGPLIALNCASFPESLLEAELFGYERGAFTGADRRREGRFEAAAGGTLFLDEVSEMPPSCQAKLLRVLQEKAFSPLGTNKLLPLNVRVITATNRSLTELVAQNLFREDLYYRIKVLGIQLPPLRERPGDLALLAAHFARKYAIKSEKWSISKDAWQRLREYSFPGNVRELEHAMEHAIVLCRSESKGEILPRHLPPEILRMNTPIGAAGRTSFPTLRSATRVFERDYLLQALTRTGGNKTEAAKSLAISRKNLWEKMSGHAITDEEISSACADSRLDNAVLS